MEASVSRVHAFSVTPDEAQIFLYKYDTKYTELWARGANPFHFCKCECQSSPQIIMPPPSKEDLNKSLLELGSINERQEKTLRYLESTTIKLVISYVVTQTLIYLSISLKNPATSSISCQHWWIPFSLSALVGVIFAIAFTRFVTKWNRTLYHYDMNFFERDMIYHRIVLLEESQGGASEEQSGVHDQEQPKVLYRDMFTVYQRNACIYLISLGLAAYTIVILKACRSILCHSY